MATIKSYTDIEQSKKLAEILPIESADMYYQYVLPRSDKIKRNPVIGNPLNALKWYNKGYITSGKEPVTLDEYCILCWSLTALLNVLPVSCDDEQHCLALINHNPNEKTEWLCAYEDDKGNLMMECYADNQIDACVAMIEKLHNLKML